MVTAFAPTPAARRRARNLPPPGADDAHAASLAPLTSELIAAADEPEFLAAIFADLRAGAHRRPGWRAAARGSGRVRELGLPSQGLFHVALFEAHCETPGRPRLDPAKVRGAGLVVRREAAGLAQGWLGDGHVRKGWVTLADAARDQDPDPARRVRPKAGHPLIDALIPQRADALLSESVHPLFVAPPDVCAAVGRTVLYGVVPVASVEHAAVAARPDYSGDQDVARHVSPLLTSQAGRALRGAGEILTPALLDRIAEEEEAARDAFALTRLIRQLYVECGLSGPGPEAAALGAALLQIRVTVQRRSLPGEPVETVPANLFLAEAARALLDGLPSPSGMTMPAGWPPIPAPLAAELTARVVACVAARFAAVAGGEGRFEQAGALYRLRAFIRTPCRCGDGLDMVWSEPGEAFRILPWWAGAGRPVRVPLPDLMDRDVLARMKPGVAFQVPPALQAFLNQDLSKALGGEKPGPGSSSLGIAWLCSFSIPIITICAFIVLSIVLGLLNFVFRWLPFVKICLPMPKR